MRVKRVQNRIVVECQHCLGTTVCQQAVHFDNVRGISYGHVKHWLTCPRCGEGYHTIEDRGTDPPCDASFLHRPVCAVCEGRGFIVT